MEDKDATCRIRMHGCLSEVAELMTTKLKTPLTEADRSFAVYGKFNELVNESENAVKESLTGIIKPTF